MPLLGLLKKNAVKPTAFFWTMVLTWTTIITLLTSRNILHIRSFHMEMARNEIRANFNKDKAFRLWAASHGGVYVPVTTKTQPSPYLKDLPERDIVTPSGRTLTLLSPAQMVRQLSQEFASIYGLKGGVTALHPVNPANTPDPWQRQALQKLADGDDEVLELTEIGGAPYLRLMRPLFVQEECLLCHQDEEIKTASTRGGANVSLPMAPYFAHQREELLRNLLSSFLFWVLGCVGIWLATDSLRRHIKERDLTATKLQQAHAELEERVRERTISLSLSNAKLGQEIAERQQAEEAARLAHAELNQIFNCNGDAMYVIARDYTVLRANDTLFDTFAVKRDAFIGKKCYDTWPTPFCRTPQCPLERILNGAKRTDYHGIDRQGADGGMVSVIVTATPLHAPGGEILGIVVTLKDISELKNAEKERSRLESRLRDSQKLEAIGTLAGGVAHDFNNILAAIIGHTELAVKQSAGDHRLADSLDKVHGAAIRGKDLIEQLLSFSSKRKRAGALLSVSTILNEVKGYLEDTLPNSIRIRQEIMPGRDLVEGDPTQIRQALLNLCANATDSMGEKGGVLELTLDSVFLDERDEAPP
ncbi:MAG: DUF3365 domain-containing protein, partial [Desulfobulbaceae bacterium]|nr:DUF3365 domain-containing protein [Desulfobulbaceae bacterium]